jgi:hypothetical protein
MLLRQQPLHLQKPKSPTFVTFQQASLCEIDSLEEVIFNHCKQSSGIRYLRFHIHLIFFGMQRYKKSHTFLQVWEKYFEKLLVL